MFLFYQDADKADSTEMKKEMSVTEIAIRELIDPNVQTVCIVVCIEGLIDYNLNIILLLSVCCGWLLTTIVHKTFDVIK